MTIEISLYFIKIPKIVKNILKLYQMIRYVEVNNNTVLSYHKITRRHRSRLFIVSQTIHDKQKILCTASKCQLKVNTILFL